MPDSPRTFILPPAAKSADDLIHDLLLQGQARQASIKQSKRKLAEDADRRAQLAEAKAKAFAARFEWKPVAALSFFEEQTCSGCGSVTMSFRGFGTLFRRQADAVERMAQASILDPGLPPERRYCPSFVPVCHHCLPRYEQEPKLTPPVFSRDYRRFEELGDASPKVH